MNILLVDTNDIEPRIAPLGLEYLGESLTPRHTVLITDDPTDDEIQHSDLIGISIRNIDNTGFRPAEFYLPKVAELVQKCRTKRVPRRETAIIIGGSAVNLMPEEVRQFVGATYAFTGDDKVTGYFERNLIDHSRYPGGVGVATKFGCPFECSYCDYPAVCGSKVRERSVSEVCHELGRLEEQGVKRIFFSDANFNHPAEHAIAILRTLRFRRLQIEWEGFINPHPQCLTEEFVKEAALSGKRVLALGVDSMSRGGLLHLQKSFTIEDIFSGVDLCRRHGIEVDFSLLFGHPAETEEDIRESFKNIDRMKPGFVDVVAGIRIYPKTTLYSWCLWQGLIGQRQSLLKPYYLPIRPELARIIENETAERENCHLSSPASLEMYRG